VFLGFCTSGVFGFNVGIAEHKQHNNRIHKLEFGKENEKEIHETNK
jgi:hypothetical protein